MIHRDLMKLLVDAKYPLSAKYDPEWIYENKMGCQCLWLTESLTRVMNLKQNMRILDLGCGKALTSIFLAKEFGATVFATDLWADPSNNWKRICEAGAQNLVFPIHADAHALPYADCFFDAVVCVNSYQFYGTSDTFLADHIARLLKPGGQFGLALWGPEMEF
jgi:Cyclopropane fatty acid synthase and related methyltransferases